MSNLKFSNAVNRIEQKCPPIWIMRQAGRYHRHYQELRKKHSFMELCKEPKLAAATALGPMEDFDFDVAILFSDLLFPLDALGMGLTYPEGKGPTLEWQLNNQSQSKLQDPLKNKGYMDFQKEALIETRKVIGADKSLIGFVGGFWTLFVYAMVGSHKNDLSLCVQSKELFKDFSQRLLPFIENNIQIQLDGGAEVVMVLDTAAGALSPELYNEYVIDDLKYLAERFKGKLGYYSRGMQKAHYEHELFRSEKSPLSGLGFDESWKLKESFALAKCGLVQGNFPNEYSKELDFDSFKKKVESYLTGVAALSSEERRGWVCGMSHGLLPQSQERNVRYFVEEVRRFFA